MKIPYGQSNFEKVVTNNFYYVDRTHYIEILENFNDDYVVFLRPRRFGKSLFCSMLGYYYDVQYKDRFTELFGNYYIGKNPTEKKNSYLVLDLDFSGVNTKSEEDLFISFRKKIVVNIIEFLVRYGLDEIEDRIDISSTKSPADLIGAFLKFLPLYTDKILYIIIDEYDLFANELLAFKPNKFKQHFGSTGFVRKFYEQIKEGTKKGVVDRIFITGVTPIALDSLSSGFNVTTNLSNSIKLNRMMGFTLIEVGRIVNEISQECSKIDKNQLLSDLVNFYDGYKFNREAKESIFNPDMILYFVNHLLREEMCKYPDNLIDKNIISDYTKIQQMFKIGDYEKNLGKLDELLKEKQLIVKLTDVNLLDKDRVKKFTTSDFVSLLFYLGIITIKEPYGANLKLKIPNYCIEQLYLEFFIHIIEERTNAKIDTTKLDNCIFEISQNGNIKPLVKMVESFLHSLSFRDFQKFDEKYVKLAIFAYLSLTNLYITKTEYEVEDGYIDLALLERSPYDVNYQFGFELKYIKMVDDKQDKKKIRETLYNKALEQLKKYRQSDEFSKMKNLKTYILIFVGDKCEVCEEVTTSSKSLMLSC